MWGIRCYAGGWICCLVWKNYEVSSCINADAVSFRVDEMVLRSEFWELWVLARLLCSYLNRAWICADLFDLVEDIFDGVIEKVLVFRSNTDEVRLVR